MQPVRLVFSFAMMFSVATTASAMPVEMPDPLGDYYRNEAPVKGSAPKPLMPGSLWRVTASGLNCRRAPGEAQAIVRSFPQGEILQAEVFRGGADEVLLNAKDAIGKPWMLVRGRSLNDRCYVRANQRLIQPIAP